jgi:L-asparagine transporter-like permease
VIRRRPVVITDADPSPAEQLRSRQIRYAAMMGIRVVCLIIAAVLVSVQAPLLWLWLPLCVTGMVLLPWMAVLIANDRLPKEQHRLAGRIRRRRPADKPTDRRLPAAGTRPVPSHEDQVVDPES